ncbi:unnamed protein product [Lupinus luteus]|uniref:Uncharacterized protein n=1 Tax=Lupinus luteus TaxID=3873 RepID=A0AAV1XTM4_LUPLU
MSAILTSSIWNEKNRTEECKPTAGPNAVKRLYRKSGGLFLALYLKQCASSLQIAYRGSRKGGPSHQPGGENAALVGGERKVVFETDGQAILKISNSVDRELEPNGLLIDESRDLLARDWEKYFRHDYLERGEFMRRWTCQARASYQLDRLFRDPPEFITLFRSSRSCPPT